MYLIFNVLKKITSVIDNEINTDEFFTEETPLNQVRFKKILPWLVREPRLVGAWTTLGWNSKQGSIFRRQAWFKGYYGTGVKYW